MDETQAHADGQERSGGFFGYWVIWTAVGLLALYVLSTGPVIKLCHAHGNRTTIQAVNAIYKPLEALYHRSSVIKRGFDWYFHVWGIK